MSIQSPVGTLDIKNATLRVGKLEVSNIQGVDTALNVTRANSVLIYDDQASTTTFTGFTSTPGVRDTVSGYLDVADGYVYWGQKLPNAWVMDFEMDIRSGTNAGPLYANVFSTTNTGGDGYSFTFNDSNDKISLYYDGTLLTETTISGLFTASEDWQKVVINYERGLIAISLGGSRKFYYKDIERETPYVNGEYTNFSSASTDGRKIRNLRIVNGEKWMYTGESNIAYTQGSVGIGVSDPQYTLDVGGDINLSGSFYQGGSPFVSSLWTDGTDSLYYRSNVEVGTANLFVDTTTSRVGIGTTTPGYDLDVNGDINFTGTFYQGGSPFVSSLWTSGNDSLYYTSSNVGIGTDTAEYTLDVHGNANVGALTTTSVSGDGSALYGIQSSNVSDFASNVSRIGTLETDLGSNATRIGTLETDLGSNATRIGTLETDLGSNATRIGTLETDLGSNATRIGTLDTDLSDNSSRITSIESGAHTFTGIKTFEGDVILESNLRINGDLLVANTVHMIVSDPIMELGANNLNTGDLGIIMTRHGETGNVAIVYDESQDVLNVGYTLSNAYENTITMDTANSLTLQVNGALNVGSNIVIDDTASNVIEVSGNVKTDSLFLGNFEVVASQGLSHVTAVSAATNDTVYLNNPTTGLVVDSNVEIGKNLTVEGDLEFNGNLTMNTITVQTLFTLDHVVSQGNTTSNTVQFTNPTTSLTATGNVEVGGELSVSGNVEVGGELSVSGNVEVGTANLFVDTTTGNVGIGTAGPSTKLHIVDTNPEITLMSAGASSGETSGMRFYGTFANYPSDTGDRRVADIQAGFRNGSSQGAWGYQYMSFHVGKGSAANDSSSLNTERMCITGEGNVGIGTTNPTKSLEIDGTTLRHAREYRYQADWESNNNQTFTIPVTGTNARGMMLVEAEVVQVAANSSGERVARVRGVITNYHTGDFYMTVFEGENATAFETYIVGTSLGASGTFTMKYQPVAGYLQDVRCRLNLKILISAFTTSLGSLTRTDAGSNSALTAPTLNSAPKIIGGNVGIGTTNPGNYLHIQGDSAAIASDPSVDHYGQIELSSSSYAGWTNADRPSSLKIGIDHRIGTLGGAFIQGVVDYINAGIPLLLCPRGGNVGIGTTNPTSLLHIVNPSTTSRDVTVKILGGPNQAINDASRATLELHDDYNNAQGWGGYIEGFHESGVNHGMGLGSFTNGSKDGYSMFIRGGGNVGIGTTTPYAKLHVSGGAGSISSAARVYFRYNDYNTTYNSLIIIPGNWGSPGIYADHAIVTNNYFVAHGGTIGASDTRIKKNIVDADDAECLETLRLLKPKKYEYKDTINRGEEPVWGFIAQEVRETLPYATQLRQDVLPNIYELANVSQSNVITFTDFNTSNLESNATTLIRTKGIDGEDHDIHLAEVIDEHTIRVEEDLTEWIGSVDETGNVITEITTTTITPEEYEALEDASGYVANISGYQNANVVISVEEYNALEDTTGYEEIIDNYTKTVTTYPGTQLFIYGQEVDDFVFLKKEAIWTVATSALQEVDRQLQAEKAKVATLETQLTSILARLDALEGA